MFINKTSENKELKNNILALAAEAVKAKKKDSSVINATTGMLKNEDGSLYEFKSVEAAIKSLNINEKFSYANSSGSPLYAEAVLLSIFGKYLEDVKKSCFIEAVATPGGSGALNLALTNYVNPNETILLPNHMWENYLTYGMEMGFNSDTYSLFNDEGLFNITDLNNKVNGLKKSQKKILILVNDPCENPTGFCMKEKDYDALLDIAKNNPDTDFIYLMDVAYFDFYNVDPNIIRNRYAKFKDMPSNAIALFVFSGSKSFGLYGLRIGSLVAISKDEKEIQSFKRASTFSCRAKWSSASTLGMSIIEKLVLHEEYISSYEEEIKTVCAMLEQRSIAFLNAAKEVGLETLPYERGFFICVPSNNPEKLMNELHKDGVYGICTHSALRIALCAINKEEAARLPKIIKSRID
ncbi:MAG: aminotransferase class I/II-fold pyridoxal phosphate-dependent enzyme [Bacilli bacterium]|nr:aminotransferase class I/II-fold pyridoxal phosphate-dependent enzyme [Bacilli bacterium]